MIDLGEAERLVSEDAGPPHLIGVLDAALRELRELREWTSRATTVLEETQWRGSEPVQIGDEYVSACPNCSGLSRSRLSDFYVEYLEKEGYTFDHRPDCELAALLIERARVLTPEEAARLREEGTALRKEIERRVEQLKGR